MSDSPPVPSGAQTLQDFSDRLPAMLVKELRQGMRSSMFVAPFVAVHLLALLALAAEYQAQGVSGVMSPFWLVASGVVALLMPLRGFAALREESDQGNSALLMLSGLSRWAIVRGKWLVQVLLCFLTFLTLMPYLLVRYFLGGFEIVPNVLMAINVLSVAAGVSGCVIGASGYRAVALRFVVAGIGLFWVIGSGIMVAVVLEEMFRLTGGGLWTQFIYGYGCSLGVQLLYCITGLQLGRAHLKLYLLPYEVAPTRAVVSMMVFLPFILLAGGIASMFYGFPIVLLIIIVAMCRYDRPWTPAKQLNHGTITGMDAGWRPFT